MTGILGQIGAWAADLKYWERAALELVLRGKGITETDYQLLADHCLCDAGLVQMPATARPKLEFSRDPSSDHSLQYRLERLFNLRNVNALPAGQELRFGEHLTLIYGENGSGKPGIPGPSRALRLPVGIATCCRTRQFRLPYRRRISKYQQAERRPSLPGVVASVVPS